jgi:hypothetical protein
MPAQELDRRAQGAPVTTPSVAEERVSAPSHETDFRQGIRSKIVRNAQHQGLSNEEPRGAADFKREELTAHAVRVVEGWSKQLQTLERGSPEYNDLIGKRDLVTRSLVAADVYSEGLRTERTIPSHVTRLEGDAIQFLLGSEFDVSRLQSHWSGYSATLYLDRSSNTILVANRGTGDLADWANNIQQAGGFPAKQYEQAVTLAYNVKAALEEQYGSTVALEFVGHSLGGGLASAQAVVLQDCRAVTFNAAGLHQQTVERFNTKLTESSARNITALQVQGDILTVVQGNLSDVFRGKIMPEAVGVLQEIRPAQPLTSGRPLLATAQALERHMMHKVLYEVLRAHKVEPR